MYVYGNNAGTVALWRRERGDIFVDDILSGIHLLSTLTFVS
jgi:hypothetical protein